VRRFKAECAEAYGDDRAMAVAPIMLQAHDADAALLGEVRCFGQSELAFGLDALRFEEAPPLKR
jgi:hypothetical protein